MKISRPEVLNIRCLNWKTAIIVFMKNAAWLEDDKKVVSEFPCLLGRPVPEELRGHKLVAVMSHKVNIIVNNVQVLLFHVFVLLVLY